MPDPTFGASEDVKSDAIERFFFMWTAAGEGRVVPEEVDAESSSVRLDLNRRDAGILGALGKRGDEESLGVLDLSLLPARAMPMLLRACMAPTDEERLRRGEVCGGASVYGASEKRVEKGL